MADVKAWLESMGEGRGMETTPQIIEETELVRPVEGRERTVRMDAYDVERQRGIARGILKDCGFISGDEVRGVVQRVERQEASRVEVVRVWLKERGFDVREEAQRVNA